jgi:hypothetical protein
LDDEALHQFLFWDKEAGVFVAPDNQRATISWQEIFLHDTGNRPAPLAWGDQ